MSVEILNKHKVISPYLQIQASIHRESQWQNRIITAMIKVILPPSTLTLTKTSQPTYERKNK